MVSRFSGKDVYGLSRGVALLILTYATWIAGYRWGLSAWTAAAGLVALGGAAALLAMRSGRVPERGEVLRTEAVFAAFFLFFLATRLYSPEILYTAGEKFMDLAFLRGVASSGAFPPEDPWMSGQKLFYYYLGYVSAADLKLLTGVPWDEAFNLVVPFYAGVAGSAAYSAGRMLKARYLPVVALVAGNPASVALYLSTVLPIWASEWAGDLLKSGLPGGFSYFSTSRVIPNTINEFPSFTFLHADPHAHMYSIPFQLTYVGLLALYLRGDDDWRLVALLALALGFFYPLNTWEFPTYVLLTCGAFVAKKGLLRGGFLSGAAVASSLALYLPFHLSIETSRGVALVHERTGLAGFLGVNGFLLALVLLYLWRRLDRREFSVLVGGMAALGAAGRVSGFPLLALLPLVPASAAIARREGSLPPLLLMVGTLVALGVEVLRVEGVYGGELARMNTVFKLYLQLWLTWSVPAAVALTESLRRGSKFRVRTAAALLVALMLVFPVVGAVDRTDGFGGNPELSGESYVEAERPAEFEALQFLDGLERGVVVEAWGNSYTWSSTAGTFTKHATVIGWVNHEVGWRENDDEVYGRMEDVDEFFRDGDLDILRKYGVDYVYVGPSERERYPGSWDRFEGELEKMFDNGVVRIYRSP